jgi:hypothetical protein
MKANRGMVDAFGIGVHNLTSRPIYDIDMYEKCCLYLNKQFVSKVLVSFKLEAIF